MKVSAVSATIPDSDIESAATEYSTSPSEAATSTMQMATKIVEIRITRVKVLKIPNRDRPDLSIIADSPSQRPVENSGGAHSSFPGRSAARSPCEAVRCRAGAVQGAVFGTVPALRSGMKNAAPRPGHGRLRKRLNAGDRPAEDQSVDVVGAFVGVDGFQVRGVAHHVIFDLDAVAAVHVAGGARDVERLAAIVALDDGDHLRRHLALVHQPADPQ